MAEQDVYNTLVALRATYPTPMTSAQLGALLNDTAWTHRDEGYGVLRKPSGSNCPQPVTGTRISKDIIALKSGLVVDGQPKCQIFDCLIDAEGRAEPTWDEKTPLAEDRWLRPVNPGTTTPDPPDPPEPPPSGPPYNETYAVEFGNGINKIIYEEMAAPKVDPGMNSVQSMRAAFDYYRGGLSWPASRNKHWNEFRAVYGLPAK